MRHSASVCVTLALVAALPVPLGTAHAAPGDTVELAVTVRGDTPWITSARVTVDDPGEGTLALDGALGTATATHPAPSGPGEATTYDLTDVVPVPADQPVTVTAPNGASVEMPGVTVGFGAGQGEVAGRAGTGGDVTVRLASGGQVLEQVVTAADDGSYAATFGDFDGSWEFGASIAAAVTRTADDGTAVTLVVEQPLPDAVVTTNTADVGDGTETVAGASLSGVTPGHALRAFGEPETRTLATVEVPFFDPVAEPDVEHLGRTLTLDLPDPFSVDGVDFATDTVTGTAPAGADVAILALTDAGQGEAAATAGGDGAWSAPLGVDASAFALVDAAVDHVDGATHHVQDAFGTPPDVDAGVFGFLLLPADTLVVFPLASTGTGDTWELEAVQGATTHTATVDGFELLVGLRPDDFSPAIDFAGGFDLTMRQEGFEVSARFERLEPEVDTTTGRVSGGTDPGTGVTLLVDVPVAGLDQATVAADGGGAFAHETGMPMGPGTEVTATIFPDLTDPSDLVFVLDQVTTGPYAHDIGAGGGRAPGLGNQETVLEQFAQLTGAAVPTAWRMDAQVAADGDEPVAVAFPAPDLTNDPFSVLELSPLSDLFPIEVTPTAGTSASAVPTVDVLVPLSVAGVAGADEGTPEVVVDTGSGFEPVPEEQVTLCTDATADLPDVCDGFPLPFAHVSGAVTSGTYAIVDEASSGALTVDRLHGGPDTGRVETAVALSQDTFSPGAADAVVVASSADFPDALAATPLAAASNAPILLNPPNALHPAVAAEVERLGVETAYVMGGEAAVSADVQVALGRTGDVRAVRRVAGDDRFETAAEAAAAASGLWRAAGDSRAGEHVLVALGQHPEGPDRAWPDALAAGQLAAYAHQPILLTHPDRVPDATQQAIADLGANEVTVVGGEAAIPSSTAVQLGPDGTRRSRIGGETRYHTSILLADEARFHGADDGWALAATGLQFPDGLAAGATAFHQGGVLVLVHGQDPDRSAHTHDWLVERAGFLTALRVVGGPAAISEAVVDEMVASASGSGQTVNRDTAGQARTSSTTRGGPSSANTRNGWRWFTPTNT